MTENVNSHTHTHTYPHKTHTEQGSIVTAFEKLPANIDRNMQVHKWVKPRNAKSRIEQ